MSRHFGARLRRFADRGHDLLAIENEVLRVEVVASKGADIVSFLHKPSDTDPLLRSSLGLRPASMTLGRDFLDTYEGGWQEIFPNGGPGALVQGASLPMHGEISTVPWQIEVLEDSVDAVEVSLSVRTIRTPFLVERRMRLVAGSPVLYLSERITNESPVAMPYMWGHHPAFGPPFLDPSCHVDIGATTGVTGSDPSGFGRLRPEVAFRWPFARARSGSRVDLRRIPPPETGVADRACLTGFDSGWFAITNQRRQVGFGMAWDAEIFPYLWYWQVYGGFPRYPLYGREYTCALEPWTSCPDAGLDRAIANGTARTLAGHGSVQTNLVAVAYAGRRTVRSISRDGEVR